MNTKPILAFDCSGSGASVTLATDAGAITRTLPQGSQATELIPTIDAMMREQALKYDMVKEIVTTIGPGSFTGLRIGLAALHGLVLVHPTPVKLLTSLEAFAWQALRLGANGHFSVALKVGKGELAAQDFAAVKHTPVSAGEVYRVPESHDGWAQACYGNHVAAESAFHIEAVDTVLLAELSPRLKERSLADAVPFYIRPPDALIPKPHAWLASTK